jgi:hypothetical protein
MYEYHTQKPQLILKEYGRNVQKLVDYVLTIEDRQERTEYAYAMIELMKQINPRMKEGAEYSQKLWDDLFIMSDFRLDVDAPFPMPDREVLFKKPNPVDYNQRDILYKHYGHNIELLIEKACEIEDSDEREEAVANIGKLMKIFYGSWNKEVVDDETILKNIVEMSNGKLDYDIERIKNKSLFDITKDRSKLARGRRSSSSSSSSSSSPAIKRKRI